MTSSSSAGPVNNHASVTTPIPTKLTGALAVEPFPDQKALFNEILDLFDKGSLLMEDKLRLIERNMFNVSYCYL